MRFRRVPLGLAILILVSGLFLFTITTDRETRLSGGTSFSNGPGGGFSYSGVTATYNIPPQVIVGTTGMADLIVLKTPFRDFSTWVCHQTYGGASDCSHFGGGNRFNITILASYLEEHQSQIAYSQTIVDQNVSVTSLADHVTSWTDVTIVLAHLESGWTRDYWQTTVTNQTTSYPLIGYTEMSGTIFTLPNISIGLTAAGAASLVVLILTQVRLNPLRRSEEYHEAVAGKCPGCSGENLFFAKKCRHCGHTLHDTPRIAEAR